MRALWDRIKAHWREPEFAPFEPLMFDRLPDLANIALAVCVVLFLGDEGQRRLAMREAALTRNDFLFFFHTAVELIPAWVAWIAFIRVHIALRGRALAPATILLMIGLIFFVLGGVAEDAHPLGLGVLALRLDQDFYILWTVFFACCAAACAVSRPVVLTPADEYARFVIDRQAMATMFYATLATTFGLILRWLSIPAIIAGVLLLIFLLIGYDRLATNSRTAYRSKIKEAENEQERKLRHVSDG